MKKRCCSCHNDITHCNNHDLACSMNSSSLKSNDTLKTDFSNVKIFMKVNEKKKMFVLIFCYRSSVIIMIVNQLEKLKQCYKNNIELWA